MSLFVVGTGTEVGKTVASAVLLRRYSSGSAERALGYWKPVATGGLEDRDTETVKRLAGDRARIAPELYLFRAPLSPHLAARLEGARIDAAHLSGEILRLDRDPERDWVFEGVGGLHVPLDDEGYLLSDLLRELEIPCLLVALSGLGTINHTLLSLEALRERGIPIAGVVLNGPPNPENRRAIERFGQRFGERFGEMNVVGEIPPIEPLDRDGVERVASGFDPGGALEPFFRRPA